MSTELEIIAPLEHDELDVGRTLFGTTDPHAVLELARGYAEQLTKLVNEQKLFTVIGGKKYVHVTGWQTLGSMLGVFAVGEGEPEYVELEGVGGFKATVRAMMRDGATVGRATQFCMRDEGLWRTRNIYALAGMAQTRATSRALRAPLGFIVKLAGFEPEILEEKPQQPLPEDAGPDDSLEDVGAEGYFQTRIPEGRDEHGNG